MFCNLERFFLLWFSCFVCFGVLKTGFSNSQLFMVRAVFIIKDRNFIDFLAIFFCFRDGITMEKKKFLPGELR